MLAVQQLYLVLEEIEHLHQITQKSQPLLVYPHADRIKEIGKIKLSQILVKLADEKVIKIHRLPEWGNVLSNFLSLNAKTDSAQVEIAQNFHKYFGDIKKEMKKWEKNKRAAADFEKSDKAFWITYSEHNREIILNDLFLLSEPNINSENELVFSYLYQNPNRNITLQEIERKSMGDAIDGTKAKLKKRLHEIVRDLGFTKNLLKLFFVISRGSITFTNPISHERFQNSKISKIKIAAR